MISARRARCAAVCCFMPPARHRQLPVGNGIGHVLASRAIGCRAVESHESIWTAGRALLQHLNGIKLQAHEWDSGGDPG